MTFWTGLAAGFILAIVLNQIRQEHINYNQKLTIERLTKDKQTIKGENFDLKGRTSRKNDEQEDRIAALENRMDNAESWFASVIRHSREQFDAEAVEKFLEECGMQDGESI